MKTTSPTRQLADILLPDGLDNFVAARRPQLSWRDIAADINVTTEGRINITHETLRSWFTADKAGAA